MNAVVVLSCIILSRNAKLRISHDEILNIYTFSYFHIFILCLLKHTKSLLKNLSWKSSMNKIRIKITRSRHEIVRNKKNRKIIYMKSSLKEKLIKLFSYIVNIKLNTSNIFKRWLTDKYKIQKAVILKPFSKRVCFFKPRFLAQCFRIQSDFNLGFLNVRLKS